MTVNKSKSRRSMERLVRRLREAAAHHEHLARVWAKQASDQRESVAWVDASQDRIADYEKDHRGKPWSDVRSYNEASIRHGESTAHQHAEMAEAILEAVRTLSPNAQALPPGGAKGGQNED